MCYMDIFKWQIYILKTALKTALFILLTYSQVMADMGSGYQQGKEFDNRYNHLGNPEDSKEFIKPNQDSSHLQNLNDSSLTEQGRAALNSSDDGRLLYNTDEQIIEAEERYKINEDNPLIKNALKIEDNPMKEIGGEASIRSELDTLAVIKKECVEGVDFDVNIGLELIINAEDQAYLGPINKEYREIMIDGSWIYWNRIGWMHSIKMKKKKFGHYLHNNHAVQSEARLEIRNRLNLKEEQIGNNINVHTRGIGGMYFIQGKSSVWSNYKFGYEYLWQDKLYRFVNHGEYWQVVNNGSEEITQSNSCYETSRSCLKSGVKKYFGKYDISRPCWYENVTYRCKSEPIDGCAHLIKQDCELEDSDCLEKLGNICLKWKRKYSCGGVKREFSYSSTGNLFCLGGDCHKTEEEDDKNFSNIAHLAALNAAKNDCVKDNTGICKKPITVFPGEAKSCKTIITGMIKCCSSMKGWGKNVNLTSCSPEEKALALKCDKGLCHNIGTHCSKKGPFGHCLVKQTTSCCFSSKLARILHEQGRSQFNIGFGSSEAPNCRPFTIEELSRIDFSKIDLSELFDDFLGKGKKKGNSIKSSSFPGVKEKTVPPMQKEHESISSKKHQGDF